MVCLPQHSFKQFLTHKRLGVAIDNNDATTLRPCNVETKTPSILFCCGGGYAKLAFPYSTNDFVFTFSFVTYLLCSLGSRYSMVIFGISYILFSICIFQLWNDYIFSTFFSYIGRYFKFTYREGKLRLGNA